MKTFSRNVCFVRGQSRHFAEMSASPFSAEKPASEAGFSEAQFSRKPVHRLVAPENLRRKQVFRSTVFAKNCASSADEAQIFAKTVLSYLLPCTSASEPCFFFSQPLLHFEPTSASFEADLCFILRSPLIHFEVTCAKCASFLMKKMIFDRDLCFILRSPLLHLGVTYASFRGHLCFI